MVFDFLRQKFKQSHDYKYEMLLRDLREMAEELNAILGQIGKSGTAAKYVQDWTPTLRFGGNSVGITYALQSGKAVKVGNLCWLGVQINLSAKGSSVGNATIAGQPYASGGGGHSGTGLANYWLNFVALPGIPILSSAGNVIDLRYGASPGTGYNAIADTFFSNTSQIRGGLTFITPD